MRIHSGSTKPLLGIALLIVAALAPQHASGQDEQATVTVSAPDSVEASEDRVEVRVEVEDARNLAGFQFVLSVDSSLLRPVSVEKTAFLAESGREIFCPDPTIEEGAVRFTCVTLRDRPPGVDGSGTLAIVTFEPLAEGISPLALSRVKLAIPDGTELPSATVDGKLTVGGGGQSSLPWIFITAGIVLGLVVLGVIVAWRRRRGTTQGAIPPTM